MCTYLINDFISNKTKYRMLFNTHIGEIKGKFYNILISIVG